MSLYENLMFNEFKFKFEWQVQDYKPNILSHYQRQPSANLSGIISLLVRLYIF